MLLTEIYESRQPKHVAFCFGRMNPPTIGHARLLNSTARASNGGDYFIFLSQTQDSKKNPLDYNTKVDFVKAMYPQHADHVSVGTGLRTIMDIAEFLYHHNYTDVTFVCGGDRLPAFKELLNKYNGVNGGKTYYKFNSINLVSSGPRDPDDDGIAGVSASAARLAAEQGNPEEFKKITGAGRLATQLYRAVRKGLVLGEEKQRLDPKCWKGYKKQGTKVKGGVRVNNCVPVEESEHCDAKNAVPELKAALEKRKTELKNADAKVAYDKIDKIMTRIAQTYKISGQELHDLWTERYGEIPDTWVLDENFADGKGPGKPGDSQRHGIPKGATKAELEKASHSAGRKGQLARWQLNMRNGKNK